MNASAKSRVTAIIILGVVLGWYVHHDEVKWNQRGRDAFISAQMKRFDQNIVKPKPLVPLTVTSIIGAGFFFGAYELLVIVISKFAKEEKTEATAGTPVFSP